jgi:hypothetical protein
LPPGVYTLRLDKEKFRPYSRDGITLRSDTTIRVNAELLPEALKAEEVTVVARPPTVDVGSSSTGMNIGQDFTRRIPVSRPGAKGSGTRSFESVAEAVPGAKADTYGVSISGTTSPENNYVLDGTSVNNPSYGTVGTPLSLEFIKELNVISGGYMPEYGRSTGGILNVVTKSGSNEFHGGVFTYYSPGALEGTRKVVIRNGQTVQTTQFLGYIGDIGADIGGPIQKDKLWFYAGVDFSKTRFGLGRILGKQRLDAAGNNILDNGLIATDNIPGTYQHFDAEQTQVQAMGKLTYAVNQDNTLTLALFATPQTSGGDGKYAISPQTGLPEADPRTTQGLNGPISAIGSKRTYNSYDASLKWSSAFNNKRVLLDTTIGWHHQNTAILPNDGSEIAGGTGQAALNRIQYRRTAPHSITEFQTDADFGLPTGTLAAACTASYTDPMTMMAATKDVCPVTGGGALYNVGGPGFLQRQTLDRYQGKSVLTMLFQGGGHHVVKAGIDLELMTYDNIKAYSGPPGAGIFYRESTSGARFDDYRGYGFLQGPDDPVLLDKVHTFTKSFTPGGFLQDSWSIVDKVTLNVGVRYDAQFLYNAAGDRGLSLPNEWSPRIGVIYDPTQSGHAKIYANYARFYESVPLDAADRSLSSEPGTQARHPSNGGMPCKAGGTPPGITTPGATLPCTDPSLRLDNPINDPVDPNVKWATLGAGSTPVDPDIKPQSSDEIVFGGEYEIIKDGRLGANYTKRWMNYVIEDMSRDEATTYFLGNPGYGIANDFPKAERKYDAVTIYFSKIFADEWLGEASYTISRLYGNYAGLFRPETGQLDPNINSDFDLKSLLPNRTGPLPGDRTHQIKLFGAKDWGLNPENHVTTGLGFRATSGEPNNTFGSHNLYGLDEVFILPRGSAGPNGVSDRLPWNFSADLQLGYQYRIDKDKTVNFTVDVFNLFNFQAETGRDFRYTTSNVFPVPDGKPADIPQTSSSPCVLPPAGTCKLHSADDNTAFDPAGVNPNYGRPTQYQPPRVFRFGLRMTF